METRTGEAGSLTTEKLVSTNEAQAILGVRSGTIRQWKHQRLIWPVKRRRGRIMLFRLADIQRMIQDDPHYDTWARERL